MSPEKGSLSAWWDHMVRNRHNSDAARKKSQRHTWRQQNQGLQEDREAEI